MSLLDDIIRKMLPLDGTEGQQEEVTPLAVFLPGRAFQTDAAQGDCITHVAAGAVWQGGTR